MAHARAFRFPGAFARTRFACLICSAVTYGQHSWNIVTWASGSLPAQNLQTPAVLNRVPSMRGSPPSYSSASHRRLPTCIFRFRRKKSTLAAAFRGKGVENAVQSQNAPEICDFSLGIARFMQNRQRAVEDLITPDIGRCLPIPHIASESADFQRPWR
jgi:hypothetical protein